MFVRYFVFLLAGCASAQSIPAEMRDALVAEFHFTPADLTKVESGKAVAKFVPTGSPDDVRMAGVVLINVSSDAFITAFRDVEHFQTAKEVHQTGRFSSPPVEADLEKYDMNDLNKADLVACRPGSCAYKMPAQSMDELRNNVDWSAPDAKSRAAAVIRKLLVARLTGYQRRGDPALAVYYDTQSPFSVAEGLHSLLDRETRLQARFPEILRYAETYPKDQPSGVDDFFYWQEASFGLKRVVRIQHVLIQKTQQESGPPLYAIVSKMLFATHYFRAAIEFAVVYPVVTPSGEPAVYFASMQRSFVDGLTGAKGAILRKIAQGRSPASLAANLELAKQKLEKPR
jgi:hypothetical protein